MVLNWHGYPDGPGPGTLYLNGKVSKLGFTFIRTFFGFGYGWYDLELPDGSFRINWSKERGFWYPQGFTFGFFRFESTVEKVGGSYYERRNGVLQSAHSEKELIE